MKKFTNAIIAGSAGILTLLLLLLDTTTVSSKGITENVLPGYDIISYLKYDLTGAPFIEVILPIIVEILLLTIAIFLIVLAALEFLKAFGVIKSDKFGRIINKTTFITLIVFAASALAAVIMIFVMCAVVYNDTAASGMPAAGPWLILIIAAVALTLNIILPKIHKKKEV